MRAPETPLRPVAVGTLVGVAALFVPVLNLLAPALGGFAADLADRAARDRPLPLGAITGLVLAVPAAFLASGLYANVVGWQHPFATPGIALQENYFAVLSALGIAESTTELHIVWFVVFVVGYVIVGSTLGGLVASLASKE